jgi:hypothetical protein
LNQFLAIGLMGGAKSDKSTLDGTTPFRLQDHQFLTPSNSSAVSSELGSRFGGLRTHQQVSACVELAEQAALDFLVLDQTRPDIEVPVVRVVVPGLRHFYRRFGPGRLYDVPIKLGLRDRPRCWKASSIPSTPSHEAHPGLRAPGIKRGPRAAGPSIFVRIGGHVALEARANGSIDACFHGHSVGLGTFSAAAAQRAQDLRTGLPLASLVSGDRSLSKEIDRLVRDWPAMVCWSIVRRSRDGEDQVVIEPQVADYWLGTPQRLQTFSSCRGSRTRGVAATT